VVGCPFVAHFVVGHYCISHADWRQDLLRHLLKDLHTFGKPTRPLGCPVGTVWNQACTPVL